MKSRMSSRMRSRMMSTMRLRMRWRMRNEEGCHLAGIIPRSSREMRAEKEAEADGARGQCSSRD